MDGLFGYAESARRKAAKQKALQAGAREQQGLTTMKKEGIHTPLVEHRPPDPNAASRRSPVGAAVRRTTPSSTMRTAAAVPRSAAPASPERAAVRRPRRQAVAPAASTLPAPPLRAPEDRLLIEGQSMDLFGTGKQSHTAVCPECRHELIRVVCLGTTVRVCIACRGVWFPYSVVQEFAQKDDWFRQLGPAFQLASEKKPVDP